MENLLQMLSHADISAYRPIVFWSIHGALEEKELRRQLAEMKAFGLGGVVFHARAGLQTEYLSEAWFRCVGVCLDEARRQGMKVWLYDEYGWPSGFAGGRLLAQEENRACYLEYAVLDHFDASAYAVYALEGGVPRLLRTGERAEAYYTIYVRTSDAYVDVLDGRVTRLFLACTHEQYFARFGESFGRELLGFFTDEPQYYRYATPFTRIAEEEYESAYGEPLKEGLLYLFLQEERGYPFRIRYYTLLNRLYCENFYRTVYDWCEAHGCMLTGHSIEENALFAQMWGGADCATSYLFEHYPAIDNLARRSDPFLAAKSVASVAAQTGREHVLTETFACTGHGITPRALRFIAERQYVYGVNTMCEHLYNYSLAGQGKIDHPPSFGRALPWAEGYSAFNEYFAKLGMLLGSSREEAPVAVVVPMESIYLDYLRLDERAAMAVDGAFSAAVLALRSRGIAYHFVNEKILAALGSVEGGVLKVGERAYEAVVLAGCTELKGSTVRLLKRFLAGGGKLQTLGGAPRYTDGVPAPLSFLERGDELPRPACIAHADVPYTLRTLPDGRRLIFAVNDGEEARTFTVNGTFSRVDLVHGVGYLPASSYMLPPHASLLLEEDGGYEAPVFEAETCTMLTPEVTEIGDNCLTLTHASVRTEDGEEFSGYVYGIFERLVKAGKRGTMQVTFSLTSEVACPARLIVERQPIADLRWNGAPVSVRECALERDFLAAEVAVRPGENMLTYTARLTETATLARVLYGDTPESLRNCFTYHTCLEPVCLEGAFDTRQGVLAPSSSKQAGDLTRMGLENFCGTVQYRMQITGGGRVRVRPVGDYAMCRVTLCGESKAVLLDEEAEFTLPEGEHVCTIDCASTMRNRFGPFHCKYDEENGVSPDHFTLRGGWTAEGENAAYVPQRRLVPFGLHGVQVLRARPQAAGDPRPRPSGL